MARTVDPVAYQEKRLAIAAAAYRTIATYGYDAATTARICAEAAISSGTFFHYFPSKIDVVIAILEPLRTGNIAAADSNDAIAIVREITRAAVDEATDPHHGGFVRAIAALANREPSITEVLQRNDERSLRDLADVLARGQHAGRVRSDVEPRRLANRILMLIDGYHARSALQPGTDIVSESDWLTETAIETISP